jgi:LAO/AO transport system kinase
VIKSKAGKAARLSESLIGGDRRALARAITLIESTRADHRDEAEVLVERLLPHTGNSVRIGISGTPGVGKSTFIEAFGLFLTRQGHKVAVLAVDPTSKSTGGSILGDKTRMPGLAREPNAFIRPSPAGGTLGGVARRTREAMLAVEAAGFDVVLVETVGVGQSETAVADMVDLFLLLVAPGGGDELQGIKRGIMELADILVVNKADGDLRAAAGRAAAEYKGALGLMRPRSTHWRPSVLLASALNADGIEEIWNTVTDYRKIMGEADEIAARRSRQACAWMWDEVEEGLIALLRSHPGVADELAALEAAVAAGEIAPGVAARRLLNVFRADKGDSSRKSRESA